MDPRYEPGKHEEKIYSFWEKGGWFTPKIEKGKKPFVVPMPPPNVTGILHIGHALEDTLTDILTRFHRMKGEPTLWLPGTDHAGIATQNVVEKDLAREGKSRFKLGREKFVEYVWQWIDQYQERIYVQHKALGASADFSRRRFTADPEYQEAVKVAFKALWGKKLIYRGERIVNWCPRCGSAISDLENEHEEEDGVLYYLDYGAIKIATTRPETIFADVAVAVHPKDARYKNLIGKFATLPLTHQKLPIIADDAIDQDFGTGALKVTPAHDELDFEIGQRHNLAAPVVIDPTGKMAKSKLVPQKYWGMKVKDAKVEVVKDLHSAGLLEKEEKIKHTVGHCQRCGTITEPLISKQWFVKMKPLAHAAIKAVRDGEIKIIPRRFEKIYFQWMENIKDWCISRQIWWGHTIPIRGETDVLDTWFSSALWPFATLGWPKETTDLEYFFPAAFLQSGYEILFFWDARMIMFSLFFTGKIPFKTLYLHGIVRDEGGRKMSKSLGNVVDPLGIIEKYGTDALRMALIIGTTPGNDLRLHEEKIIGYRNFANKVWNIARFVLAQNIEHRAKGLGKHADDEWILGELEKTIKKVSSSLEKFKLSDAGQEIYDFIWHRFADIYIEKIKSRRQEAQPTLLFVLQESLKLLHPFMPFVTEVVWQEARKQLTANSEQRTANFFQEEALIIAPWPKE